MRTMHRKIEVANPHRMIAAREKGSKMAKHSNAKNAASSGHSRKKPNPFKKKYEELLSRRRKSRNPASLAESIGRPSDVLELGLSAVASAVAVKQLPQMVLSAENTGAMGYVANGVVTVATTWLAGAFIGKAAAQGALAGGLVIILDRILTDKFSELGPVLQLSGVGDATSYGKLGTIRDGYYFHPDLRDNAGNLITPQPVLDASLANVLANYPQLAAPVQAAVSQGRMGAARPGSLRPHVANGVLMSSRFQGRMNR